MKRARNISSNRSAGSLEATIDRTDEDSVSGGKTTSADLVGGVFGLVWPLPWPPDPGFTSGSFGGLATAAPLSSAPSRSSDAPITSPGSTTTVLRPYVLTDLQ